jgi:hypothetical protein
VGFVMQCVGVMFVVLMAIGSMTALRKPIPTIRESAP